MERPVDSDDDLSLRHGQVLVVDCQSTGASPAQGSLLEIGWSGAGEAVSRLVALPEEQGIPRVVTRITGIASANMHGASEPRAIWADLTQAAEQVALAAGRLAAPTVIHYARFELAFLRDLEARFGHGGLFPFDVVCTHEIARRLLPGLPRRSLRALAGYYGFGVEQLRRAASHVEATAFVWRHLIAELEEHGVGSWDRLHLWLADTPPVSSKGRRVFPIAREQRLAVPDQPGIYRLLRKSGDVLYVGKATSLRRRVNSYFTKQRGIHERHLEMLSQARDLSVTVTNTTLEAALLESDEIKRLQPPYNVQLREIERSAWFASPDLAEARSEPDAHHRIGPLPSRTALTGVAALAGQLAGGRHSKAQAARALGVPPRFGPEQAPFVEGLALFRQRHLAEGGGPPLQRLMTTGKALWRLQLAGELDLDGDPDDEERSWDPERIARHLTRMVLQAGQLLRRSRWLCLLAEAAVGYCEPGGPRRLLCVERARVVRSDAWTAEAPLPIPPGALRSRAERQRDFDVAAYDRLRVLSTELRRVTGQGGEAAVCLGPGRVLSGAALERVLAWT